MKRFVSSLILVTITSLLFAEGTYEYVSPIFEAHGIKTVTVVAKGYKAEGRELLKQTYEDEITAIAAGYYGSYGRLSPYFITQTFSPGPTSPDFPLPPTEDPTLVRQEAAVAGQIASYLNESGYKVVQADLSGQDVAGLMKSAEANHIDSVFLVRFFVLDDLVQIYGKSVTSDSRTTTVSASVGKYRAGLGFIPSFELFDAATGNLLYLSYNQCRNDESQGSINEQAINTLFVDQKDKGDASALEQTAAANVVALLKGEVEKLPSVDPASARQQEQVSSAASSRGIQSVFWTPYEDHSYTIEFFKTGYLHAFFPEYTTEPTNTYTNPVTIPATTYQGGTMEMMDMVFKNLSWNMMEVFVAGSPPVALSYTDKMTNSPTTTNRSVLWMGLQSGISYRMFVARDFQIATGFDGQVFLLNSSKDKSDSGSVSVEDFKVAFPVKLGFEWNAYTDAHNWKLPLSAYLSYDIQHRIFGFKVMASFAIGPNYKTNAIQNTAF